MRRITITDSLTGDFPIREGSFTPEGTPNLGHLIEKLRENYSLFGEMTTHEMVELLRLSHKEMYETGHIVFREGEPGTNFYLLVSGSVLITIGGKEVARLGAGHCFGEMAILDDTRRNATAAAAERTLLLSIDRDVLLSRMPDVSHKVLVHLARELAEKLREADEIIKDKDAGPMKESGAEKDIGKILEEAPHETYASGQTIFREGESGTDFYVIIFGEVIISQRDKELARLKAGDSFGEMAALGEEKRTATATAAKRTQVLIVSRDVLNEPGAGLSQQVLANLARQLASKLKEADKIIEGTQGPRKRLFED